MGHTDPKHCDKYYTCYMKKATQHTCPMNLLFNSFTRTCAVSALVSCGDRERPGQETTVAPTTPTTPQTPDDDFQCNTYLFGRHTDPKHCDKYYAHTHTSTHTHKHTHVRTNARKNTHTYAHTHT